MSAAAATALAPALRMVLLFAGAVLVSRAVQMARRVPHAGASLRIPPSLLARVVVSAARLAAGPVLVNRRSNADALLTRLAAAPACWPARLVAHAAPSLRASPCPVTLIDLVAGIRCLCAIAVSALVAGPAVAVAGPTALAAIPPAALLGAFLPDAALARAARRSAGEAERGIATAVDLVAACASAGLSLQDAMVLTAGHAQPPIAAALRSAAIRRSAGEDPRKALELEAARFRVNALADVGLAVDRQRRLGVPLGPELARIAERLRTEHRARSLERVARRAPLATLVVALVIAPLCVAALVACLIGGIVEGGTLGVR